MGGLKGFVKFWDVWLGKFVCEYFKVFGDVMDVDFSFDGSRFVIMLDIVKCNLSDKFFLVWNFVI